MGSGASIPADKKIVIIGAGYAGNALGTELLSQNADFTMIDVKDSFYHNVASVRSLTEAGFASKLFISYEKTFGQHFKQGKVTSIKPEGKLVVLEDGQEMKYDVLIIATGSTGHAPFKTNIDSPDKDVILQLCNETVEKVNHTKEVVIIGGGAVGCEVAAELATDYKDIKVTVIQGADFLVTDAYGATFQKNLQDKLKKMRVNVILGEKVTTGLEDQGVYGPCQVVTDKGNSFNADLVIRSTGIKVNNQAYASSLASVMNENGSLQVNEYLQVKGYSDIFAIGDCNDVKEPKMAYRAGEHVKLMKQNLKALFNDQPLKIYEPQALFFGIGLSLGRNDAIGVRSSGGSIPAFMLKMLKSKDLMLPRYYKEMKQKPPK